MESAAYKIEENENYSVLTILEDKFTATIAPDLKSELVVLKDKGVKNIIINLENAVYCDSSGLSIVLIANRICKEGNGCFVVCGLQHAVEKLVDISQLTNILNITPTLNEAVDFIFMDELERGLSDSEEKLN